MGCASPDCGRHAPMIQGLALTRKVILIVFLVVGAVSLYGVQEPEAQTRSAWGAAGAGAKPAVAAEVSCPQERVVDEAGNRLNELAENVSRFDAVEEIVHEEQNEHGKTLARIARKYAYVVLVAPSPPGGSGTPTLTEDRTSLSGASDFPGGIGTLGLPTLAFIFHPGMRHTFELYCEGLGNWQGEPAWLVQFRQREDRPNYLQGYRIGERLHSVALKGRAWIAAVTFQVVHMEAELVRPMPEIKLLLQHYVVDYGQVSFQKQNTNLWLPKQAELYFHFRGRRYYRRHSFDNFRLFSVDSSQKVITPEMEDPRPER